MVSKHKCKKGTEEFPEPNSIYHKEFDFLYMTLEEMQKTTKKDIKKEAKKVEIEKEIPIKAKYEKVKTKLGVTLEEKSEGDTDSDSSFIISNDLDDIIRNDINGKETLLNDYIEFAIEMAPITKHELRIHRLHEKWVSELIESKPSENNSKKPITLKFKAIQSPLLMISPSYNFHYSIDKQNEGKVKFF